MSQTTMVDKRTPLVLKTKAPSAYIRYLGIDVAKATISICMKDAQGIMQKVMNLRNTEAEIRRWVSKHDLSRARVVMESTGSYHWIPTLVLNEAGCDVRVVNPLLVIKYTKSAIRKVKNDPADARMLCEVAEHEANLPPSFNPTRQWLALRKKMNLLKSLEKQIQISSAIIEDTKRDYKKIEISLPVTIVMLGDTVKTLIKQKQALEKEFIAEVITERPEVQKEEMKRLTSVPGVSPLCAALIIHAMCVDVPSVKSWSAYVGLDVSVRESGTWKGRSRLTKRGNPYLRKRIFCAAWGAIMNDDRFRKYYDYLRNTKGKTYVEALIIIARKQLRILYSIQKKGIVFDNTISVMPE